MCRRCRCDLQLLREVEEEYMAQRLACLRQFQAGRTDMALAHARQCHQIRPDDAARQLLAVCALTHGEYAAALNAGGC